MTEAQKALAGALIGVARTTDGHARPTEETFRILREGLTALSGGLEAEQLEALTERVREEKFNLVPGCRWCASPCGHNADFDLRELDGQSDGLREMKYRLLEGLEALAAQVPGDEANSLLCEGLFLIGYAQTREELLPLFERMQQMGM